MPWSRGQSGNPGGRPKALAEVVTLARAETAANVAALVRIRDDMNSPPAAVVAASIALLDRAWGRPTTFVAGDDQAAPLSIEFRWQPALPEHQDACLPAAASATTPLAARDGAADTQFLVRWDGDT